MTHYYRTCLSIPTCSSGCTLKDAVVNENSERLTAHQTTTDHREVVKVITEASDIASVNLIRRIPRGLTSTRTIRSDCNPEDVSRTERR